MSTVDNVRLTCRPHNLEAARRVFGDRGHGPLRPPRARATGEPLPGGGDLAAVSAAGVGASDTRRPGGRGEVTGRGVGRSRSRGAVSRPRQPRRPPFASMPVTHRVALTRRRTGCRTVGEVTNRKSLRVRGAGPMRVITAIMAPTTRVEPDEAREPETRSGARGARSAGVAGSHVEHRSDEPARDRPGSCAAAARSGWAAPW
jgi:hypothetical protein